MTALGGAAAARTTRPGVYDLLVVDLGQRRRRHDGPPRRACAKTCANGMSRCFVHRPTPASTWRRWSRSASAPPTRSQRPYQVRELLARIKAHLRVGRELNRPAPRRARAANWCRSSRRSPRRSIPRRSTRSWSGASRPGSASRAARWCSPAPGDVEGTVRGRVREPEPARPARRPHQVSRDPAGARDRQDGAGHRRRPRSALPGRARQLERRRPDAPHPVGDRAAVSARRARAPASSSCAPPTTIRRSTGSTSASPNR